jgi:signal transduction histidine kinase
MEVLKYLRKNKEIKMINKIPPKSLYLTTDEKRFQQILYNLIDNSLKYTDSGYLELSAHTDDSYLYLYVTDTGRGIDYTTQKMLFKENLSPVDFYFLGIPSAGLGLYISKLLAVRLGGDLYLEWSKPGTGSIFALKLPINNKSLNSPLQTDETAATEACENNTLDIPYLNTGNNNDNFGYRNKILLVK